MKTLSEPVVRPCRAQPSPREESRRTPKDPKNVGAQLEIF